MSALLEKAAEITSPQKREQMRRYRRQNKGKLKRKRRIRERRNKNKTRRPKKRIGNPSGGYKFIRKDNSEESGGEVSQGGESMSTNSFDPNEILESTERETKLEKQSFLGSIKGSAYKRPSKKDAKKPPSPAKKYFSKEKRAPKKKPTAYRVAKDRQKKLESTR